MYTVLSVVCPITVVRVLIFRSAEAKVEKQLTISAKRKKQRNRRVTAGLLKNDANTLPNKTLYEGNSRAIAGLLYPASSRSAVPFGCAQRRLPAPRPCT